MDIIKNLKFLREATFNDNLEIIVEQQHPNADKTLKIKGPYIVCEEKNGNGRIYRSKMMEGVVKEYKKNYIDKNMSVGEMNHPSDIDINFKNACHMIEKLARQDNVWIGTSKVLLGVPQGDLLAGLLQNGVKVGISTRGVGTINESTNEVEKYRMICADIVSNPSGPGAFCDSILESKRFMIDSHGDIVEQAYEKMEKQLSNLSLTEKNQQVVEAVAIFLKSI